MIRLALAKPGTAVPSFDRCCATPVLPVAIGRQCSPPRRLLPREAINAPRQQAANVQIPIASDAQASSHLPRFPPLEVCVRRPHVSAAPPSWGRHPQTFTETEVFNGLSHVPLAQWMSAVRSRHRLPPPGRAVRPYQTSGHLPVAGHHAFVIIRPTTGVGTSAHAICGFILT